MVDYGIDIIVASPSGHVDLAVEVKLTLDLEAASHQLTEYMRRVGAGVGLVVGKESIRILRDTYRSQPSIQVIGEFPIGLAKGLQSSGDALEFEERVQRWLESMRAGDDAASEPLLTMLREHVLPVMTDGTVRAARPRAQSAAR